MAVVELIAVGAHHCTIQLAAHKNGFDGDLRGVCVCGWKSPRYGPGDRKTLEDGMAAHSATMNAKKDAPPRISACVDADRERVEWLFDWERMTWRS